MTLPSLLPAIALLGPKKGKVTYALWVPAAGPDGEGGGAWGAVADLPRPYSVDVPTGAARNVTVGGEEITADLELFCRGDIFPPLVGVAGSRAPRVFFQGVRFRVIVLGDFDPVTDHVRVLCARDLGRESA